MSERDNYLVIRDFNTDDWYIADVVALTSQGPYPTREAAQKVLDEMRTRTTDATEAKQ